MSERTWDDLSRKEKAYGVAAFVGLIIIGAAALTALSGGTGGPSASGPHRIDLWFYNECHDDVTIEWEISPPDDYHWGRVPLGAGEMDTLVESLPINETSENASQPAASVGVSSSSASSDCAGAYDDSDRVLADDAYTIRVAPGFVTMEDGEPA